MNYLIELDTAILSVPPIAIAAIGIGCRYIEFSENPIWREVGWTGARIMPFAAVISGTPLVVYRFACSLLLRIAKIAAGKHIQEVVEISDFMDKRLTMVITGVTLIPVAVIQGPWIFQSTKSISHFAEIARSFYFDTFKRFNNISD